VTGQGIAAPSFRDAAPRGLCTDCGVSRLENPKACGTACQFIKPDYPRLEAAVHGRVRDPLRPDELHFGPFRQMLRASLKPPQPGAQWTGITTRLAEKLLDAGAVTAVLTMAPDPDDKWKPVPVLVTKAEAMAACRGMRMGYAPLLALLEPAAAAGHKRIAVIGIPCQVYALRALEAQLGLDALYVIGTPCSDNTATEKFHHFLTLLSDAPETLADITVGYMGGQGGQWLLVRNERGEELLRLLGDEITTSTPGSAGKRAGAVKGFLENTRRAAGGLPLRRMPDWLRPIIGWLMPRVGPRGLEFARARVEMKAVETVLHLERAEPAKMRNMIPDHVWALVAPYGLKKPVPKPD